MITLSKMKIKVLYEDKDILVIDKPSGILVHPDNHNKERTILDWVLKKYKKAELVHRLDRETTGAMIISKNQKAHEFLKKQFSAPALGLKSKRVLADRQDRVNKTYVAIVNGHVKNDHGVVNKPIGRSPRDFRRWLAGRGARGELREAITEYKVLKRFKAPYVQNFSGSSHNRVWDGSHTDKNSERTAPFTYLEVRPKTGRTHQIRVHMKFLNHPVACDSLYNPGAACPKGLSRLALHAKSIEFNLPAGKQGNLKGKTIKVESPVPLEFKKIIK